MEDFLESVGVIVFLIIMVTGLLFIPIVISSTDNNYITNECTENKILLVKDKIIKCEVLDKKVISSQ